MWGDVSSGANDDRSGAEGCSPLFHCCSRHYLLVACFGHQLYEWGPLASDTVGAFLGDVVEEILLCSLWKSGKI